MKSLGHLLAEADELIMGKAAAAQAKVDLPSSEIQKLATELLSTPRPAATKTASQAPSIGAETICKIAHARAIMDVLINLPTLKKMAAFEEKARAAGHGEEKIAEFFEKNASAFPFHSSLEHADWIQAG